MIDFCLNWFDIFYFSSFSAWFWSNLITFLPDYGNREKIAEKLTFVCLKIWKRFLVICDEFWSFLIFENTEVAKFYVLSLFCSICTIHIFWAKDQFRGWATQKFDGLYICIKMYCIWLQKMDYLYIWFLFRHNEVVFRLKNHCNGFYQSVDCIVT